MNSKGLGDDMKKNIVLALISFDSGIEIAYRIRNSYIAFCNYDSFSRAETGVQKKSKVISSAAQRFLLTSEILIVDPNLDAQQINSIFLSDEGRSVGWSVDGTARANR